MPKKRLTKRFIKSIDVDKQTSFYDTETNGLILRATKTGTKTWCYRYRVNGKYKRKTLGRYPAISIREARKKATELTLKRLTGDAPEDNSKVITFKELVDRYMSSHLLTLKETSQKQYKSNLKTEILPFLGDMRVDQITKQDILEVLDKKALQENKPTYANQIRLTISSVFSYGLKRDLCSTNPVSNTSSYEGGIKKRTRYYRKEEIIKLWKAFSEFSAPTDSVFKVLLLTGQRKSETCQMQWSQITGNTWTIPAEVTKNGKSHEVPLSKFTKGIIDSMDSNSPYVFPSPRREGEPIMNIWMSAKKIQDNTIADFQTHDLRRTFATHCAQIGIQRNILGRLINHTQSSGDNTVTAIYDRYSYRDEKRAAMKKYTNHIIAMLTGSDLYKML